MPSFSVEKEGLKKTSSLLERYPNQAKRARTSSLKSVGNYGRQEMKNFIEYGGSGWPRLHPLSAKVSKTRGGKWRKKGKFSPLFLLGRFARYAVDEQKGEVRLGLGKTRKGQSGGIDKMLNAWLEKHEKGKTISLSPEMRVRLRHGFLRAGLKVLKRTTTVVKVPKRPIIKPVFHRMKRLAPKLYEDRYVKAIERYMTGRDTKTQRIGL